jgi:hypothetical protein
MKMCTGRLLLCGVISFWLVLAGCTTSYYPVGAEHGSPLHHRADHRESADKETYGTIREKTKMT